MKVQWGVDEDDCTQDRSSMGSTVTFSASLD